MTIAAAPLQAQTVRGRVLVDGPARQPIEGALVALTTGPDSRVDAAFTNAEGHFQLTAPASGDYTVTIDRIGFANWQSEPVALALGQVRTVEFAIPIQPVLLAQLDVSIHRGCIDDPRRAEQLYAVWDEARKALEAALLAQKQELLRFNSVVFDRQRFGQTFEFRTVVTGAAIETPETPFQSLPADKLSDDGYIQEEGETIYFYAPDAEVLLSDTFLADHCFGLDRERVDGRQLVGLTFDPVDGRDLPDIKGVLWLDEETAELDHVEFEYREIPYRGIDDDDIGGRIDFRRLPTGAFVVDDWVIRMPVIVQTERDQRRDRYQVAGFTEHGGELRNVFTPDGTEIAWGRRGSIRGVVQNPLTEEPLSDATVQLDRPRGPDIVRHTGPGGGFLFDDLGPGKHKLRLSHPMLELLERNRIEAEVEIEVDGAATVAYVLPTPEEILDRYCPADTDGGLLMGRIRDRATDFPARGITVWIEFTERTGREAPGDPPAGARHKIGEVSSDQAGRYTVCGIPLDTELDIYLAAPMDLVTRKAATTRTVLLMDFEIESAIGRR